MPGADKLPDLLRPGLDLVICGAAAGRRSAEVGAYYAGPGNRFWRTLHETGLTPRLLAPEAFRSLPDFGIGLTDLAKTASGSDAEIPRSAWDAGGLRRKIEAAGPRTLAFNGKNAAQSSSSGAGYVMAAGMSGSAHGDIRAALDLRRGKRLLGPGAVARTGPPCGGPPALKSRPSLPASMSFCSWRKLMLQRFAQL